MSFIYRDFLIPSRFEWNRASALYHKFNRVWGKSTINGVEVYDEKLVYWSGSVRSDTPFKRFINALGVEYTQLQNSSYDGVDNVYFKLEPSKYSYSAPEKAAIVSDLDSVFNVGDEFELYIHYSGQTRRVVNNHWKRKPGATGDKIGDYTIDTVGIRATLSSDPMRYFANADLVSAGTLIPKSNTALSRLRLTAQRTSPRSTPVTRVEYDEDTTHIYATLAILDNGTTFEQHGSIYDERTTVKKTTTSDVYFEYSYKIRYKVISIPTIDSYIVNQIDLLSNAMQTAINYKGGNVYAISNVASDTTLKEAVIAMNNVEAVGLTYQGQLRVDAVALMKRKEFAKMLGKIFGTGYKKKKTKWYEKALAIVIVVVAVVIGVVSAGGLSAVSTSIIALAQALAVSAAAMSIGMMLYAAAFPYATDQTKMIGKFAQIVGLAAMVTGVYAAIQQSWKNYVMAEATKQAGGVATESAIATAEANATISGYLNYMVDQAITSVTSSISSLFTSITTPSSWTSNLSSVTMNDVSGWLKSLNTGMDLYVKFFGDKPQLPQASDEQATKEDGVEAYYAALNMLDEVDALVKMDYMIKGNAGGEVTERLLTRIT